MGVSSRSLIEFNLGKDSKLTPDLYKSIRDLEEKVAVSEYLIRLLGRRDHARNELIRKARKKGYDEQIVSQTVDELDEKDYLDDESFARSFAADKQKFRKWGPGKISSELSKRGVSRAVIQRVISELNSDLELGKICVDLALKRKKHFLRESNFQVRRRKIAAWLQRKGYSYDTIRTALPEIMDRIDDS